MNVDLGQSFQELLDTVVRLIPQILLFLVILIVGWLIAKVLEKATHAILEKVGFNRLADRGGLRRSMNSAGYDPAGVVGKLVFFAILLITLQLAFGVFGPNPVSDILAGIIAWLPQAFVAVIIIIVTAYLAGVVRDIIRGALAGRTSYGAFLAGAAFVFILGLGIIAALAQVGIAFAVTGPILIAVLATIAGILIVGVGGGLVRPMQARWERMLRTAELEMEGARSPSAVPGTTGAIATTDPTLAPAYRDTGARPGI